METNTYTVPEYLELEEQSEIRHEYYDGEIFAMAGTTLRHNEIIDNVRTLLRAVFKPKGCKIFAEGVKVECIRNFSYCYPDAMVTCSAEDFASTYIVRNPSILVEVLSKSSAGYDQVFKLKLYKQIASLQYYLLVSQNECYVQLYTRSNQGDVWTYQTFAQLTDEVPFEKFGFSMSVAAIYEDITFLPEEAEPMPPEER
ncbi:Uma2 family endonuclease [Dyadobacter sandarakinus]|uniref:Uma2 family endonuclease n=1 Tax=Dyadobacter sandarakinus TaxID=2747268 RepID=A0ABX7IB29_9BACT|nr:Uma2 family endonuclease [Dyadobacter sandarakinus]QRR03316.1 Uma2 family endonuclease [Dyadobacter sandarakinus]